MRQVGTATHFVKMGSTLSWRRFSMTKKKKKKKMKKKVLDALVIRGRAYVSI